LDRHKIRRLRESRKLSQLDAAILANTTPQFWSNVETGNRTKINIETLDRMAKALRVKAKDLLR
jgi:transcriptional regulator with XRE-family HTH domain